jgi:hypothetical protein
MSASFQPLQVVGSHPHANLEDGLAARRSETCELVDVRFQRVPCTGVSLEVKIITHVACATGLGIPEFADALF